jgi:dipeptidase
MNLLNLKRVTLLLVALVAVQLWGQEIDPLGPGYPESCTSIMVGKSASTDGSVMTAHSCDGNYRTWIEIVPGKKFDDASMHKVYWGTLHTETAWDMRNLELKGEIPEVKETYSYLSVAYPCLNEKQLAIGETTITGRRELRNSEGLFLIEELEKIALERCTTAREAIKLMGSLAEKYGYGDWAECLTVADPKEVWHFEIAGAGTDEKGALWCAQRIPDDHVGISANISRISDVDFNNPDFFMTSSDLRERSKKLKLWDGKSPFKFYQVISGRKPYSRREHFVLSTIAPSLNLTDDMEELPFSVKPEKKLSPADMMAFYRETYEGTEWDMTQNLMVERRSRPRNEDEEPTVDTVKSPVANPWMSNDLMTLLNTLAPETVTRERAIAIAGCSYSHVIQCRDWLPDEVGAVAWLSFDNPGQSPRIPVFSGTLYLPESFKICGQHRYRTDAAIWSYREANRLATVNWGRGRELIEPAVMAFEKKGFEELPMVEEKVKQLVAEGKNDEAREYVTQYTNNFAFATMKKWESLKGELWYMFGRGF